MCVQSSALSSGVSRTELRSMLEAMQAQRQQVRDLELKLKRLKLHNAQTVDIVKQEVAERLQIKQPQQYWDFEADPAEEIYADQLVILTRLRLQMQMQEPSRALCLSSGLSMGPEVVKWDPKAGFILKMQVGMTLPFALNVTADSYWRFFGCGYGVVSQDESDLSTRSETPLLTVSKSTNEGGSKCDVCRVKEQATSPLRL
eukprot:jgi/Phyca11/15398/fgenesh1_pg.PHYCAscaffold_13_\